MVAVSSAPPGATIRYGDHDVGVTPATISMRYPDCKLTLRLTGYHERTCDVGWNGNDGWVILGMLMWGPFELIVDASKNAWGNIDDRPVHVELAPEGSTPLVPWARPAPPVQQKPSNVKISQWH